MAPFLLSSLSLLIAIAADVPRQSATVTLSLEEYEKLRRSTERSAVTVIDTLQLAGSFAGRDLSIAFSGRSSGTLPTESVLGGGDELFLYGCDGEAIVSRAENGSFQLTPLAPRFTARCRLVVRGSDRLDLRVTRFVLWVDSRIQDGELVPGAHAGGTERSFSVVRRTVASAEGLPVTAMGRYRITLLPDETRFRYQIDARNPNRSHQPWELKLAASEHVQQVDASVPYDVRVDHYRFDLPPGESVVVLSGSLPKNRFAPPIDASVQYCLIESHPLLRPVVEGVNKRVSPQEVGLPTQYRGAQAFLMSGREGLTWTATRLEALRTTAFAINRLAHVFFLSADGIALGETSVGLDNQGASDITVPMDATAVFASLQGEPVLLTKDPHGDLWLPIALGPQQLLVQHQQPFSRFAGIARARLALPRLPVAATSAIVELRFPEEWHPVVWSFLSQVRTWTPDAGLTVGFLVLLLWTERVLAFLRLPLSRRLWMSAGLAATGVAWGELAVLAVVADLLVTTMWLRSISRRWRWNWSSVVVAVIVVMGAFLLLVAIAGPSLLRSRQAAVGRPAWQEPAPARMTDALRPAEKESQEAVSSYQGLPAKIEMPTAVRQDEFSRRMLTTDPTRVVTVFMLSQTLVFWLQAALVAAVAVLVWRARAALASGWRARVNDLRPPPRDSETLPASA